MLAESYRLSRRYANEYMDENPIVGEPGSFRLTKSYDATLTTSMSTNRSAQSFKAPTPAVEPAVAKEAPPLLRTEDLGAAKKLGKGGEKSPITPGVKDKKDKKERRKSKAAGSGETTIPKATTPKTSTPTATG